MSRALVVLARYPRAERVKTRLASAIGAEPAARLYRAFLADMALRFSVERSWDFYWAFEPASSPFPAEVPGRAFPQRGGSDLGTRMAGAMEDVFSQGYREVVLIGSDLPHLPKARITEAFDRLSAGAGLVLGPAADGGYYLIGATSVPPVFTGVSWGGRDVLRETVERARAAGLEPALIELAYDLDRKEDLERLWNDDVALATVPATREALAAIFTARSTT